MNYSGVEDHDAGKTFCSPLSIITLINQFVAPRRQHNMFYLTIPGNSKEVFDLVIQVGRVSRGLSFLRVRMLIACHRFLKSSRSGLLVSINSSTHLASQGGWWQRIAEVKRRGKLLSPLYGE
jgi:hypothetical protein